ncbi:CvpA family protein [Pseudohalocynthiibacter aestuariivivens]|jgi:membrane protein required for colicin V production|uniref:CvpA family protein n=1 Tax=Pseudohalocynthiibacter aestuariivivens TaxID=1591409 RepID=A0ABV5JIZ7_9RHOB|nr:MULTISPECIES: CvpA family protein [Pseudohalocynthiibacter]MBS9716665.1 CvpA family protein [Pseudohalocynthiibacter aestuariivivens]MCK0101747.1 CvpA family protein [Pseudohalocynthiibacter sp. F2068]
MEGFTIIDGVVAIVIIISALLAYSRGFVREALSIGGWIAAAILAYLFADQIRPLVNQIPVLGEFVADQCELSLLASFAVVMVIGLIVMSIFTPLFSGIVQRSFLGGFDQGIGFLFGVARGVLLVVVGLVAYDFAVTDQSFPMVDESRTAKVFAQLQTQVGDQVPEDVPGWLKARFEDFVGDCGLE